MFQKNIITFTFADVASILKNYWNHVRERKKNNDGRKIKIPHCTKYSISLGRQAFNIVDDIFTFTVIPYKLKISIQLPPYMTEILNNHVSLFSDADAGQVINILQAESGIRDD